MLISFQVISSPLDTCPPDAIVTQVALTLRDRDHGDVFVVEMIL